MNPESLDGFGPVGSNGPAAMGGVERFDQDHDGVIIQSPHGTLVRFTDYDRLRQQLAAALAGQGRESARLDWLVDNCAVVETDGSGKYRVRLDWTNPESYGPYADSKRDAIDAALADDAGGAQGDGQKSVRVGFSQQGEPMYANVPAEPDAQGGRA